MIINKAPTVVKIMAVILAALILACAYIAIDPLIYGLTGFGVVWDYQY